jgi:hypothetical protein
MFPFLSIIGSVVALGIGWLDIHIPNLEIYADTVIYRGPNGEVGTGKEVRDLPVEKPKISDGSAKLFDYQIQFFQQAPESLDVPVSIVYNSQLSTTIGLCQPEVQLETSTPELRSHPQIRDFKVYEKPARPDRQ